MNFSNEDVLDPMLSMLQEFKIRLIENDQQVNTVLSILGIDVSKMKENISKSKETVIDIIIQLILIKPDYIRLRIGYILFGTLYGDLKEDMDFLAYKLMPLKNNKIDKKSEKG